MQTYNPNAQTCWIAGFSFGAWVSMQLMMRRPEISGFISIAPPTNIHDFSFLAPCPASGLILHGDKDEVVPITSVDKFSQKLQKQNTIEIDYRIIKGCDHFFQGHLDEMISHVDDYLDKNFTAVEPTE
jgi:alpha/beta superfamily hydrolase